MLTYLEKFIFSAFLLTIKEAKSKAGMNIDNTLSLKRHRWLDLDCLT